mgnify:CR=1 FL=1
MKKMKFLKIFLLVAIVSGCITTGSICYDEAVAQPSAVQNSTVQTQPVATIKVLPLAVVNSPKAYLNKNIVMEATFDKFSTLGLDYKPAFKSSEDYISFLIKRDDTEYNIPLSEMKLFLQRKKAEKFIDLKTDDKIEIKGIVFSDALGDVWVDVTDITITQKAPENDKK